MGEKHIQNVQKLPIFIETHPAAVKPNVEIIPSCLSALNDPLTNLILAIFFTSYDIVDIYDIECSIKIKKIIFRHESRDTIPTF